MPQEGSLIFVLDSRLRKRNKPRKRRSSKHYDSGMAIDLRYNPGFYAPVRSTETFSLPATAALGGGSYRVEAFEGDEEDTPWGTGELDDAGEESRYSAGATGASAAAGGALLRAASLSTDEDTGVPVWGTGQLDDATVTAASLSDDVEDAPIWGAGQLETLDATPQTTSLSNDSPGEPPAWGTGELQELDTALPSASSFASPAAAGMARKINEERLLQSDDPDTRAFAQDIQSILAGKKEHPSTTGSRQAPDQPEEPEEDTSLAGANRAYASSFSHDVFDQMGRNMSMAKTFDLGSYDLSRQFDVFDQRMDSEESASERKRSTKTEHAQSQPSQAEFAEDMAWMSGRRVAPAPTLDTTASYDLRFDVPLIPQQTGYSCWAAGCAMLVVWRDQMSVDPSEIARATGAWAAYANGLNPQDVSVFPIWGISPEPAQSYTVQGFYDLLNTYGPLWVASAEPDAHIRVVTGLWGDGTPDGTTLSINDPWEAGMTSFRLPNAGAQSTETYTQFVRKQETLAGRESNVPGAIYVAHLQGPRRR